MPFTPKRTTLRTSPASHTPEDWPQAVDFVREICGDLRMAERREWLVTNGIGGYASGTVAGSLTRCYHGLLIAALQPPVGRTLLVSKLEETVECQGQIVQLSTNHWSGGTVAPTGFVLLERFHLEGTTPVWTFAIGDARLEKRIWMEPGQNTTYVTYAFVRGSHPIRLRLRAFVNHREFHGTTLDTMPEFSTTPFAHGLQIFPTGGTPFILSASGGAVEPVYTWYHHYDLPFERERGISDHEHHLHIGTWMIELTLGEGIFWMAGTRLEASLPGASCIEAV